MCTLLGSWRLEGKLLSHSEPQRPLAGKKTQDTLSPPLGLTQPSPRVPGPSRLVWIPQGLAWRREAPRPLLRGVRPLPHTQRLNLHTLLLGINLPTLG